MLNIIEVDLLFMKKGCPKIIKINTSPEAQDARHDGIKHCGNTNKKKMRDTMSLRTLQKKIIPLKAQACATLCRACLGVLVYPENTPRSAGVRDK